LGPGVCAAATPGRGDRQSQAVDDPGDVAQGPGYRVFALLPRCPGPIADLAYEPLLAGLGKHFAMPLAGELVGHIGMHGRLLSVRDRPGPGLPSVSDAYASFSLSVPNVHPVLFVAAICRGMTG
jgi:hypothetical protein